jgi:hypothetical protein
MISCLSKQLKQVVAQELERSGLEELISELETVPVCPSGIPIEFTKGRAGKSKREPSKYQKFIGECMRSKNIKSFGQAPQAMRECAAEWRKLKK